MKKFWVNLVSVLLFAALAMTCAVAEPGEEVELDIESDVTDVGGNLTDDIILDNVEMSLDDPSLPDIGEFENVELDSSMDINDTATIQEYRMQTNDKNVFEIDCDVLIRYNGSGGNVIIPDGIKYIGTGAFSRCSNMTSISIPDSVISIREFAFQNCTGLTSITIPNSVTSIGRYAFSKCSNLISITLSENLNTINDHLFWLCTSLTNITIPNSVTRIDGCAFRDCSALTSIHLSSNLTVIWHFAFQQCSNLAVINIPNNVSLIGGGTFYGCSKLSNVTILSKSIKIYDAGTYSNIPDTIFYTFGNCADNLSLNITCNSDAINWARRNGYPTNMIHGISIIDPSIMPTCTRTGLTDGSHCSVCDAIIKAQQIIPATGHTPVTDPTVAPTCTEAGLTEGSHCSVCGEILVEQKTIPAKGHKTVVDKAVAATLKKTGLTEGSHCSVCGKILVKQKTVPKLISIKSCKITGIGDAVYTGKVIQPAPVVKYKGKKLVKGTDYTVKYANNKAVGTATVTITGVGKYGESVSKTFNINPKDVALAGLTAGKQQLTVKWKKGKSITGYEVQYDLNKSFTGAKTVAVKKTATKTVLKKLTTGKKYYVRIRAYKTVKGKKYYSAWSKAKSAKVK